MKTASELSRPQAISWDKKISKWPWWAIALVGTGLLLIYLILASPKYNETFFYLTQGMYTTLRIR